MIKHPQEILVHLRMESCSTPANKCNSSLRPRRQVLQASACCNLPHTNNVTHSKKVQGKERIAHALIKNAQDLQDLISMYFKCIDPSPCLECINIIPLRRSQGRSSQGLPDVGWRELHSRLKASSNFYPTVIQLLSFDTKALIFG